MNEVAYVSETMFFGDVADIWNQPRLVGDTIGRKKAHPTQKRRNDGCSHENYRDSLLFDSGKLPAADAFGRSVFGQPTGRVVRTSFSACLISATLNHSSVRRGASSGSVQLLFEAGFFVRMSMPHRIRS
jgi:hypothetical protein